MKEYFETVHNEPEQDVPTITYHETLEKAITFAETHNIMEIFESLDTYVKCWFCGDWIMDTETDTHGTCRRCQLALFSRGEH